LKNKLEEEAAKLKVQMEWNAKHKSEIAQLAKSVSTLKGDVADMRNSLKGPVYIPQAASSSTNKDTPKTEKASVKSKKPPLSAFIPKAGFMGHGGPSPAVQKSPQGEAANPSDPDINSGPVNQPQKASPDDQLLEDEISEDPMAED
jgi:hypothetical protein